MSDQAKRNLEYAHGKLTEAVATMALSGKPTLRERIAEALQQSHAYDASDFPAGVREAYRAFIVRADWAGTPEESMRNLTDAAVRDIGGALLELEELARKAVLRADWLEEREREEAEPVEPGDGLDLL